jgi:hypothetical protein
MVDAFLVPAPVATVLQEDPSRESWSVYPRGQSSSSVVFFAVSVVTLFSVMSAPMSTVTA